MTIHFQKARKTLPYRILSAFIAFTFSFSYIVPPVPVYGQGISATVMNLPVPGTPVALTPGFTPARIIGMTIHADNPLMFDFMVDPGDMKMNGQETQEESLKLVKYFLASLTVPAEKLWVNLSPYEKDKIVPEEFGLTEMGTELLAQDYMLKQLTASLMNPEDEVGKKFWDRVYEKAQKLFGTTEIPLNTFNKVWIVPEKAVVYVNGLNVFVLESRFKVMLEEDYLALEHHNAESPDPKSDAVSGVSSSVIKEVLLPEIEKEVNEGNTFANLRQIQNSLILATWYKQNLKESLLGKIYADKAKTGGLTVEDKEMSRKIYDQYVEAFRKGVHNFIKEDYDPATQQIIPRKYFSGGVKADPSTVLKEGRSDATVEKLATNVDILKIESGIKGGEVSYTMPFKVTTQGTLLVDESRTPRKGPGSKGKSSSPLITVVTKGGEISFEIDREGNVPSIQRVVYNGLDRKGQKALLSVMVEEKQGRFFTTRTKGGDSTFLGLNKPHFFDTHGERIDVRWEISQNKWVRRLPGLGVKEAVLEIVITDSHLGRVERTLARRYGMRSERLKIRNHSEADMTIVPLQRKAIVGQGKSKSFSIDSLKGNMLTVDFFKQAVNVHVGGDSRGDVYTEKNRGFEWLMPGGQPHFFDKDGNRVDSDPQQASISIALAKNGQLTFDNLKVESGVAIYTASSPLTEDDKEQIKVFITMQVAENIKKAKDAKNEDNMRRIVRAMIDEIFGEKKIPVWESKLVDALMKGEDIGKFLDQFSDIKAGSSPLTIEQAKKDIRKIHEDSAMSEGKKKEAIHEMLKPITEKLNDKNSVDRWGAAYALREIGDPAMGDVLMKALKDTEWNVRFEAARALKKIGHPKAGDALIKALKDGVFWVDLRAAAKAVEEIDDPKAVGALTEALKDKANWGVRIAAAYALGDIGGPEVVPALTESLKDKGNDINGDARRAAAWALGRIGSSQAMSDSTKELVISALTEALKDERDYVREMADQAINRIQKKQSASSPLTVIEKAREAIRIIMADSNMSPKVQIEQILGILKPIIEETKDEELIGIVDELDKRLLEDVWETAVPYLEKADITRLGEVLDRLSSDTKGGIDLNPGNMDMQTNYGGERIQLPMPDIPLESIQIDGLVPVILRVAPVVNLPLLLGLKSEGEGGDDSSDVFRVLQQPAEAPKRFKAKEVEQVSVLN